MYICWVVCNIIIQGYIRVTKFPLAIRTLCLVHCACQIEKIYNVQSSSQWCYKFFSINPTISSTAYGDQYWHENMKIQRLCEEKLLHATSLVFFWGTRKMCRFNMPSCLYAFLKIFDTWVFHFISDDMVTPRYFKWSVAGIGISFIWTEKLVLSLPSCTCEHFANQRTKEVTFPCRTIFSTLKTTIKMNFYSGGHIFDI